MAPSTDTTTHRIVVIANEACVGDRLFQEIHEHRGSEACDVVLVAPALTSRVRYWLSDEDPGIREAEQRIDESVGRLRDAGINVSAHVGDADPLQALDDAVREYRPDEIIVATHPPGHLNWLEQGFVAQARERFQQPVTHVVVDHDHGQASVVDREAPARSAPAHERHRSRDVILLVIAAVLAIGGTLFSLFLYETDAESWVTWTWVLLLDLGLKFLLAAVLWTLFQRRPRADRLDF